MSEPARRGPRMIRLVTSDHGTDDYTFSAPSPAAFVSAHEVPKAADGSRVAIILDCMEDGEPVKRTLVLVRAGRVWICKPGFRLVALGSYWDHKAKEPVVVYEAIVDVAVGADKLS